MDRARRPAQIDMISRSAADAAERLVAVEARERAQRKRVRNRGQGGARRFMPPPQGGHQNHSDVSAMYGEPKHATL